MISELKITVANRLGKSYVQQAYATHPFKIAPVGEHPEDPTLHLMIRSSSPGILDNDQHQIEINVNESCHLNLQTQSYQRIFKMETGATQQMVVNLASQSHFCFFPHPLVPHENAKFQAHTIINMDQSANVIWGDIITCGRKFSGEVFRFTSLRTILEIYRHKKLIFKDHLLLTPGSNQVTGMGQFENFTHQATLVYVPACLESSLLTDLHAYFLKKINIAVGITELAAKGILIRILGHSGEYLFSCLQEVSSLLQKTTIIPEAVLTPL
ncbi:urease accessory protein UreD [Adhaeribacter swui]|uniref:Urease accessory protein UreD n=1 Tax=Adhaeribacter swui TaxID=2086471 RepID=A0A7G7GDT4_9BACT|nr:urease accessory protein UreD [Adhaeribacter swui]QNF35318.1 urease accessory protein UreD [Adhaeribacter swui]